MAPSPTGCGAGATACAGTPAAIRAAMIAARALGWLVLAVVLRAIAALALRHGGGLPR